MRLARSGDHWRKVYKRQYNTSLDEIQFTNVRGLGNGIIEFEGGITAICGANGVGKTTVLNAIFCILCPFGKEKLMNPIMRLSGANLVGTLKTNKGKVTRLIDFLEEEVNLVGDQDANVDALWLDPSLQSPQLIDVFYNMNNVNEMLEAFESRESDADEIEMLSYIIGKNYTSVTTYEIEDIDSFDVLPYFRVSIDNNIYYGTETMGLGELSIHNIIYQLRRVSKNSIVLLEEPEAFLAPRSQEALLDVLAKYSEEKGIWIILTTHSPSILKKIPYSHTRVLSRVGNSVKIIKPSNHNMQLTSLGIITPKSGIILVEDRFARELLKVIIGQFDPGVLHQVEVIDCQGEGNVTSLLKTFPEASKPFKLIGVFDGDKSDLVDTYNWPYTFLPGHSAPEYLFKSIASRKIENLARMTGRSEDFVYAILSSLEGLNHHDWFEELHKKMGLTYEQLLKYYFELWIEDDDNNLIVAEQLFDNITNYLN
ncbi:ATP-dependent endonuclease [Paenibacillus dendritiformis]|uniref:ATP-dependent nuclease n=1 Tax=Paenibacillus dendritiformis TaxID=130049 RepID=UPI003653E5D8